MPKCTRRCRFISAGNQLGISFDGSRTTWPKNLFVICVAYYLTYLPVLLKLVLSGNGVIIPDEVQLVMSWTYRSSAVANGFLYMVLHSSVRRELRRLLPRCRLNTVAPATTRTVGDGGNRLRRGWVNTGAGAPGEPVTATTSACQCVTERMATTVV